MAWTSLDFLRHHITWLDVRRVIRWLIAVVANFALILIQPTSLRIGTASYFLFLTCLYAHPAKRLGAFVESLVMVGTACVLGMAYSIFGHWVAWKTMQATGEDQALAVLAGLEALMLLVDGLIRSASPRLFFFSFQIFMNVHFAFLEPLGVPLATIARNYTIPVFVALAVNAVVSLVVFPELGSDKLGKTLVLAIDNVKSEGEEAVRYFLTGSSEDQDFNDSQVTIESLHTTKTATRTSLSACKTARDEAMFEASISYLSPRDATPLLRKLRRVSGAADALVGACELKFLLLGEPANPASTDTISRVLQSVRPDHEIAHANRLVLRQFIASVRGPVTQLSEAVSSGLTLCRKATAYCYDADSKLDTSGLEAELAQSLANLSRAMDLYDTSVAEALHHIGQSAAAPTRARLATSTDSAGASEMLMPRPEYFLTSSFLLHYRDICTILSQMLSTSAGLVDRRRAREHHLFGRRLWFASLSSRKLLRRYLLSGGSETKEADVASVRSPSTEPADVETQSGPWKYFMMILQFPSRNPRQCQFAFKFAFLVMAVSIPAFVSSLRSWYVGLRGAWIGFVAALCVESSIGATFSLLLSRTLGLTVGSAWGYASYMAACQGSQDVKGSRLAGCSNPNPYVMTVVLSIGMAPMLYLLLRSPYPKAASIMAVSCLLVLQSTLVPGEIPGDIRSNFAKRCVSMLVGGSAALFVQVTMFPVRARTELVLELVRALQFLRRLNAEVALVGRGPNPQTDYVKVASTCKKLRQCLDNAQTFLEASAQEPRLKGDFEVLRTVYKELIFVLHQITDKYQNLLSIRQRHGSIALDVFAPFAYVYRREVYGSLASMIRAVEEGLAHKIPLPQLMPSARIAHLRFINRIREALLYEGRASGDPSTASSVVSVKASAYSSANISRRGSTDSHNLVHQSHPSENPSLSLPFDPAQRSVLSWNSISASVEEVTEYVEEMVALTRLVVGETRFRHSFLNRPLNMPLPVQSLQDHVMQQESSEPERFSVAQLKRRAFSIVGDRPLVERPETILQRANAWASGSDAGSRV